MPVITPQMGLTQPVIGVDNGLTWEQAFNGNALIIDAHNHTPGHGAPIRSEAISIDTDLPFNGFNATTLRTVRFTPIPLYSLIGTDLNCLLFSGVDFYVVDGNGTQIPITSNGGVAGAPGSIANLVVPASASYVSGSETFVWQSNSNVAASLDARNLILRNSSAGSHGLTLMPPAGMAADYSLILPALPASTSFLTLTSSGTITASTTLTLSGTTIQAVGSITSGGKFVPYSSTNASAPLAIVRGSVNSSGSIIAGEGFTVTSFSGGVCSIAITNAFTNTPVVVANASSAAGAGDAAAQSHAVSTSSIRVETWRDGIGLTNFGFNFIAMG